MKDTIGHPHYRPAHITCACGGVYDTFSTRGDFAVEICAKCHPFYTGQQKLMDTAGRIDRFKKKYAQKPTADAAATDKTAPTK
jgi:large subunit ribosomal protein L31